jgi:predicted alpha/beta superfamily hydrolase
VKMPNQKPIKGVVKLFPYSRNIWVYLPPSYETSDKYYPVYYVQDGVRLFDPEQCNNIAVLESWFDQAELPEFILVGVETLDRNNEYTPWKSDQYSAFYGLFGGEGDAYLHELIHRIKPVIDKALRTLPDRANTGIAGASLGGLISLYAGLKHKEVFSKIIGLSTSAWFNGFLPFVRKATAEAGWPDIYIDIGGAEGRGMIPSNQELYNVLLNSAYPNPKVHFAIDPKGTHTDKYMVRRFPQALKWLTK